jgi:hypothetical protein
MIDMGPPHDMADETIRNFVTRIAGSQEIFRFESFRCS